MFTKKVKVIGHRSHESIENHVLACISVISGTVGMVFGIVVYNHEWIIFCYVSVQVKGQGHRLRSHSYLPGKY